jgi:hypothetical protein
VVAAVDCPDEPALIGLRAPWAVITAAGRLLRELGLPAPEQGKRNVIDEGTARLLVAAATATGQPLPPGVRWEAITTLWDAARLALGVERTQLYSSRAAIRRRAAAPAGPNCCSYCRRPLRRADDTLAFGRARLGDDVALCPRCEARESCWVQRPHRGGQHGTWSINRTLDRRVTRAFEKALEWLGG